MGIITGSIITVLIPQFSKRYAEKKINEIIFLLRNAVKKITVLLIPILVFCILFGNDLIVFLYTEKYSSSGLIFQIYTLNFFLTVVTFTAVLNSVGQQNKMILNSIINLSTNILFNLLLIENYGSLGAVFATLISTYLGYIYPIYIMKYKLNSNFLEYFPLKQYLLIVFLSLFMGIVFMLIYKELNLSYIFLFVIAPIYYFLVSIISNKYIFNFFNAIDLINLVRSIKINNN